MPTALVCDDPEQICGVGLARLYGSDLPVNFLRFHQASGVMVTHGQLHGLFEGDADHGARMGGDSNPRNV